MTTNSLVPIAVSSQFDASGDERVHAVTTSLVVRATWQPPPPPVLRLYVAVDTETQLRRSLDGGASFTDTVPTGLTSVGTEPAVMAAGGRLFHLGSSTTARVSTDAVNFSAVTGIPYNAGSGTIIKVGTEWQWYGGDLYISTDGASFTQRSLSSGVINFVKRPAVMGTTIVGTASGNRINVSTNSGVTFTEQQLTAFISSEGIQRTLATPTGFLLFGRATGSGNLLIGRSPTGLLGSWTTAAGPATAIVHGVSRDPINSRIVIVLQTGETWYSDDNGVVWEGGASCPYAGAGSFPPAQENNMIFSDGYFYFTAAQGGGVNRIYRTQDGEAAWQQVYQGPSTLAINSMCEFAV